MFYPSQKEFMELAKEGNLIPVYKEIIADMETPVSAFKKIESEYAFLLESVEGGEKIARYSFLGACSKNDVFAPKSFSQIKTILKQYKPVKIEALPRFSGGLVGYIGYDMVREIEDISNKNSDDLKLPPMLFLLTSSCLAFDHVKHKILIISNAHIKGRPVKAYKEACRKINQLEKKLKKPLRLAKEEFEMPVAVKQMKIASNINQKQFERMVEKGKEYIRAGDIIQVVLSQRFSAACSTDPFLVYRILRTLNPSPYMFYLKMGKAALVGSSPEVMVRLDGKIAIVRPIAGTRRRGRDEIEDKAMADELLASEKEKAEHIMLVDLARNDLGRVCEIGSVNVTERMIVERYSHVMHIVSNVVGRLRKGKDAVDLLMATFPAGTVSGAPKVRAMEIIDELENLRRGPYAGCVGHFGFSGDLDTCITIRTILIKDKKAYIQAGAGIVADSIPAEEYKESINKAKAMLKAVELAR
ncbi:MAG: anthranilate synthase component I [Candidatus Margulisbacteria bacterium]|nr:anthranilate synthase component I [Candidatus Margulisiibacteriota bacterium]